MPFEVQYWRDSDLALGTTDEEFRAGIMLAWASWHQVPAASVPNDDAILIAMSGMGRKAPLEDWLRIKPAVLREWVLCSDGRYYHPKIAERAMIAWAGRIRYRGTSAVDGVPATSNAQRVRRIRYEHKTMRAALKSFYGIVVAHNAPIDAVREFLIKARSENPDVALEEKSLTEETLENQEPETVTVIETVTPVIPETVMHYSPITGPPVISITGQQVKGIGTVQGIGKVQLLLPKDSEGSESEAAALDENSDQDLFPELPGAAGTVARPNSKKRALPCPVQKLVALYETYMPNNPRIRHVTDERKRAITKGWQEAAKIEVRPFQCYSNESEGLEAWESFFQTCAASDFLTGKAPSRQEGQPPFMATIDFLMKPANIVKCIENKYHR